MVSGIAGQNDKQLQEDYWNLKCGLLELIKTQFDENEITIPYDQLDVNVRNNT